MPGSGAPIFQAAMANLNPWTEVKVDTKYPGRGPLLIISADHDHTVPWAIANASYKLQQRNPSPTEIVKLPSARALADVDAGWQEVAEKALEFVKRFA